MTHLFKIKQSSLLVRYSRDDAKTYMYRFMHTFSAVTFPDWSEGGHGEDIGALFGIKMVEVSLHYV